MIHVHFFTIPEKGEAAHVCFTAFITIQKPTSCAFGKGIKSKFNTCSIL